MRIKITISTICLFVATTIGLPGQGAPQSPSIGSGVSNESIVLAFNKVGDGKELLKQLESKFEKAGAYVFESDLTTYKKGKAIKQSGKFYFKSPNLVRFEVQEGGRKSGSVVVRQPDGQVKAKSGGIFGKIVVSLSPASKMLISANGFNILKSDLETLLQNTIKKIKPGQKCVATSAPCMIPGLGKAYVVEILDGDSQVEQRIVVDPGTRLPKQWMIFDKDKLFSITKFSAITLNANFPIDVFVLDKDNLLANAKAVRYPLSQSEMGQSLDSDLKATPLSVGLVKGFKELNHSLRKMAQDISSISSKSDSATSETDKGVSAFSEIELQSIYSLVAEMEIISDCLSEFAIKLEEYDKQYKPASKTLFRWKQFNGNVQSDIANMISQLDKDSSENIDPSFIRKQSLKVEQETRRLDNIMFGIMNTLTP